MIGLRIPQIKAKRAADFRGSRGYCKTLTTEGTEVCIGRFRPQISLKTQIRTTTGHGFSRIPRINLFEGLL